MYRSLFLCHAAPTSTMALAFIAGMVCSSAAARASIHNVSRINDYALSFDDLQFTNTIFHLSVRQDRTADAPGDFRVDSFALLPAYSNFSWEGFDGITVTNVTFTPTAVSGTITSPEGLPGYTILRYDSPPNGTNIDVGLIDDRYRLTVSLQSGGGVDIGFPATFMMTIPGDWSESGTGLHQHELVSYNPAWTLRRDFAYDADLDATIFELSTDAYQTPPAPNFRLYGIPSPGGAALLGLAGANVLRRRRSAPR